MSGVTWYFLTPAAILFSSLRGDIFVSLLLGSNDCVRFCVFLHRQFIRSQLFLAAKKSPKRKIWYIWYVQQEEHDVKKARHFAHSLLYNASQSLSRHREVTTRNCISLCWATTNWVIYLQFREKVPSRWVSSETNQQPAIYHDTLRRLITKNVHVHPRWYINIPSCPRGWFYRFCCTIQWDLRCKPAQCKRRKMHY